MSNVDLKVEAGEHVRICKLFLSGVRRGQLDDTLCFLCTITFLEAISSLMNFVINVKRLNLECDLLNL